MHRSAPRLELMLIVTLAALAAFFSSVVCLRLGLWSMTWRYPIAVLGGYLVFLALMRVWIAWKRSEIGGRNVLDAADVVEVVADLASTGLPDTAASSGAAREAPAMFAAGRSGGGGGGGSWAAPTPSRPPAVRPSGAGFGIDLDWDELWPLVLALACALGGLIAIVYVIYAAPVLLAEVALDAAVMSVLYRRLRREDASHWTLTVIRKTWIPALVITLLAAAGGWALQTAAPDARSIGGVLRAINAPE
jgi:hypothetical protein